MGMILLKGEFKRCFDKAVVSTAVCLRQCLLRELDCRTRKLPHFVAIFCYVLPGGI